MAKQTKRPKRARPPHLKNVFLDIDAELHAQMKAWCADHNKVPLRQMVEAGLTLILELPDEIVGLLLILKGNAPAYQAIVAKIVSAFDADSNGQRRSAAKSRGGSLGAKQEPAADP